jgi:hypothetical protein
MRLSSRKSGVAAQFIGDSSAEWFSVARLAPVSPQDLPLQAGSPEEIPTLAAIAAKRLRGVAKVGTGAARVPTFRDLENATLGNS